ncbi:MAG: DUF7002 family protein [Candidatus Azotimanducaceae bacterium WSBS_2022_MAG_OTU7]
MDKEKLVEVYPQLFHMAEVGSWGSIQADGLLSTSALLDLYGYTGNKRAAIECTHRPQSTTISTKGRPPAVIRDQKPMSDATVRKSLVDGTTPAEWYKILNSKTFFWASRQRLVKLLSARAYRDSQHDVLTLDTAGLVNAYQEKIVLSPMNSGATVPFCHPRTSDLFKTIQDYPFDEMKKKKGGDKKAVVEVCVEGGVPDISRFVTSVDRMQADKILDNLYAAP